MQRYFAVWAVDRATHTVVRRINLSQPGINRCTTKNDGREEKYKILPIVVVKPSVDEEVGSDVTDIDISLPVIPAVTREKTSAACGFSVGDIVVIGPRPVYEDFDFDLTCGMT